ncbi:MAG: type I-U CRISPR-associated protein Cas5/Cas6 [Myxococcales bacterium]|nr:type I-U CRISPR-associated protein Cas5/Cas6 [Myxococcales bacterium]
MIAISFTFPAGRFHATPWDHHVNEGVVEWPPSPWRLTRALLAAAYKIQPVVPAEDVRRVLDPLRALPSYVVPPVTEGHTRHYMPTDDKPTKVFDAFVVIGGGELVAVWPEASLESAELALLDRVLDHLTYLGRAESWVDARRLAEAPRRLDCTPSTAAEGNLTLPAVEDDERYAAWRAGFEEAQHAVKKSARKVIPADWWDVIHQDTGRLFKDGWSSAPGLRRVSYRFDPQAPRAYPVRARSVARPTVARFEIASAVLPRLTEAVAIGDRLRDALLARSDGHPTFLGRVAGQVRSGHEHAFFLPADDDSDGRIDHLLVYAREGFDAAAQRALERLRELWGHGGHTLYLTLVAMGEPGAYGGVRQEARQGRAPQLGAARIWESVTPFVPPRVPKVRGGVVRDSPEDEVRRLLVAAGASDAVTLQRVDASAGRKPIAWRYFRRRRLDGGGAVARHDGFGFRLEFAQPQQGPIAIGYGAHQGLGQFVAIER